MKPDHSFNFGMFIVAMLGFLIMIKISFIYGLLLFASVGAMYTYHFYKKGKWK
jgi:hypothetical protein